VKLLVKYTAVFTSEYTFSHSSGIFCNILWPMGQVYDTNDFYNEGLLRYLEMLTDVMEILLD